MKLLSIAAILLIASTNTFAEVNYNYKDESHKEDMICIGAYSVGKDMTYGFDNAKYREFTNLQNNLILKYAYSKQLNTHYTVRKTLLKSYGNDYVIKLIKKCKNK
jgi:hypothetical protein